MEAYRQVQRIFRSFKVNLSCSIKKMQYSTEKIFIVENTQENGTVSRCILKISREIEQSTVV